MIFVVPSNSSHCIILWLDLSFVCTPPIYIHTYTFPQTPTTELLSPVHNLKVLRAQKMLLLWIHIFIKETKIRKCHPMQLNQFPLCMQLRLNFTSQNPATWVHSGISSSRKFSCIYQLKGENMLPVDFMDDNEASGTLQVLKFAKKYAVFCKIFDNFYSLLFRMLPSIPLFSISLFTGSRHHFSSCFQPHFQIYRPSRELSHYSPVVSLFPLHRFLTFQLIKKLLVRDHHPLGQTGMKNG